MSRDPSAYFDHSATTPVRPEVRHLMMAVMESAWGNPSSLHGWGERAAEVMENARWEVAALVGARPEEVVFTSGGTEANNLALLGSTKRMRDPGHLIISSIEHAAVAAPAAELEQQGWRITRLPVDPQGFVRPADLQTALQPDTALVSIIHGHNEIGTVQDMAGLAACCQERGIPFHTDAVQTVGHLPVQMHDWGVDLLSLSGHKWYAPQGIGALIIRAGLTVQPILHGGGQEGGLRSGTPSLPLIAALGEAARLARAELVTETHQLRLWQQYAHEALRGIPRLTLTGSHDFARRLPHHLSYLIAGGDGNQMVRLLDQAGIAISSGSACQRGKPQPSPSLLAIGHSPAAALGAIRISMGKTTTQAALDHLIHSLQNAMGDSGAVRKPKV